MRHTIGKGAAILMDCTFDCAAGFSLGNHSVINGKCRLDNKGGIFIGENVSVSQEVMILSADHDINSVDFAGRNRAVFIGDFVFVGSRALIMPGVTVGKGAVIAAGAVVTKDVEPFAVVAGVPAKVITKRLSELDYRLNYRRLLQ